MIIYAPSIRFSIDELTRGQTLNLLGDKVLKIKFILAAFLLMVFSGANAAAEKFSFDLSTNVGYSATGWVYGDFNDSNFTAPAYYGGEIIREISSTADAGILSGAITNLLVKRTETSWQFLFDVVNESHTTYFLWNLVSSGELLATASKSLLNSPFNFSANENEVNVMYSNNTTRTTDTIYGSPTSFVVTAVPEIDGSKLPQALLLLLVAIVLAGRGSLQGLIKVSSKQQYA